MSPAPAGPGDAAARATRLAALALVFNAFTWGVSWWPFRELQAIGLHPLWVTAVAYGAAALLLAARRPRAIAECVRTPALWVLVLAAGTTNATFNWAVTAGDVVRVVLLFYLMPLWAVLLARPLLGERLDGRALSRLGLALAGALVVLWPTGGGWPLPRDLPDFLALVGGVSFALNNVMLRREAHRSEDARALAMFSGGALVALVFALVAAPSPAGVDSARWLWPVGPAVAALSLWFLASNLSLQYGAARLAAHATAVIMLTEVFFAAGSAIALGAAVLEPKVLMGGALIIAAAALAARRES
ncbi:MAG: EamA family transporter [Aquabacterium sp.]